VHNLPVIIVEFKPAELQGFISHYAINDNPILDSKLQHVICRVPSCSNIMQYQIRLEVVGLAS
jgi:hypothetical protein